MQQFQGKPVTKYCSLQSGNVEAKTLSKRGNYRWQSSTKTEGWTGQELRWKGKLGWEGRAWGSLSVLHVCPSQVWPTTD